MPLTNFAPVVAERLSAETSALRLFALQQKVRRGLVMSHAEKAIPAGHHMMAWRKARPSAGDDRESYEREWLKRKEEIEKSETAAKHKAFIEEMSASHKAFVLHHQTVRVLRDKICKQIRQFHKNAERMRDKEKQERLAALKSNDFDKYREIVKNAKVCTDRHTHISRTLCKNIPQREIPRPFS